ncbi:acyl-CoA dehydrogenase [Niveispirillum sp. BGYR6]|uniref:acyl-CoA dehydrogenase n=1 Tax=Niveispirillum sp. BGYR6 TaxID=2971249 RepID=UPI0022B948C8|nr:acyl-CoA dehydrogenase [Niveispirillum sp. BGYR6]MDG5495241.1 acyl-CoA dehydrogenase [Niveispirillum sp. BGYR6]
MTAYNAPIRDMRFTLNHVVGLPQVASLPGFEEVTPDLADTVLEEAGKLARDVLAPLNWVGDQEGATLENGSVRTATGFKDAYWKYVDGGWNAVPFDPEFGGQGLPWTLALPIQEMWTSANMSFALCPMLNQGAVELLQAHGSAQQKQTYLEKLISGEWAGTMNLTEPQAGSDVGAVRTKAVPGENGTWLITGQKIFITYGEHDFTDNIVHLVLARTPTAPAGIKGISLFVVPKFLVNEDGSLGARNDLRCAGLEHKMGIHASPTAVMAYGDHGGAIGYLVGEENRGIEYMFTMMNNARLGVGLQGVAIAERAYQQALDYAKGRIQSRALTGKDPNPVAIIKHPDVRRMLLSMKSQIEAARALVYYTAAALDNAHRHNDADARRKAAALNDLLTPITKAWSTDLGVELTSLGVQIHGGMGFIEETGAAQHYRDARIAPIYEGTNGIQANDLVFRKVLRDGGAAAGELIAEMKEIAAAASAGAGDDLATMGANLSAALQALEQATAWVVQTGKADPTAVASGAVNYLRLFGVTIGGFLTAKAMLAAQEQLMQPGADAAFLDAKMITGRFYADQILPTTAGLLQPILAGHRSVMALAEDQF